MTKSALYLGDGMNGVITSDENYLENFLKKLKRNLMLMSVLQTDFLKCRLII